MSSFKAFVKSRPVLHASARAALRVPRASRHFVALSRYKLLVYRCSRHYPGSDEAPVEVTQSGVSSPFFADSLNRYVYLVASRNEMGAYAGALRAGDTVLDIGGSIGAFTVPLAKLVGSRGAFASSSPTITAEASW